MMCWMSAITLLMLNIMSFLTDAEPSRRVVGGTLVQPGDYPFLVSLWYMKDNPYTENTKMHHVCGGTLIDQDWVLTVAHCFDDQLIAGLETLEDWKVYVGKHNQLIDEETNQVRSIAEVHRYGEWNFTTFLGDAALLKLNEPIDLSANGVATIKIDTKPNCAVTGAECYSVGWGQVAENPYGYGMYVPVMTELPVVDTNTCKEAFKLENTDNMTYYVDDTVVCAGYIEGGIDTCFGDSGSPLVCKCNNKEVVSGIVSTGHGCARKDLYGIYTRVSVIKAWIKQVIGG